MDFFNTLLGACSSVQKSKQLIREEDASEMQLNAFEFRNYRTSLEPKQQQLLERVVNQWCAMLVKGKTMKINDFEEKIYLDKDMLNLEYSGELFPLKAISRMEMFKDMDDMVTEVPWGLDVTFEFQKGDSNIRFNFAQERHRINFALTLRILRTRDPTLDLNSQTVDVLTKDEEEGDTEDDPPTFNKLVSTQRFNIQLSGIPIVFSVSDLKITSNIRSTSRHVYLEFFVRYPRQDRFLYAKSGTTHIPQQVIAVEDMKRKKKSEKEAEENDEEKKMEAKKKAEEVKCTMKFDLKNVKLKIPKVPHQIFGRLMAKVQTSFHILSW
ncbi:unnamed protein product [Polarella glacialis]|uniref:Uncharacterized protein n=1 Tax=Polarella glacialis TaxID=89957 RepID=A0A813LRG1_POLGL|nr:unnamed protein product [Polarella glacialis]CAE8735553.1 unnamed protein product [Polarella glacialis]